MDIQMYLEKMKNIQEKLLNFIDNDEYSEKYLQIQKDEFDELKICENQYKLKLFLYLLSRITCNHQRKSNFFQKIEWIILLYKKEIMNSFSNNEIFNFFKGNKRILLFLLEEHIVFMNEYIIKKITTRNYLIANYHLYFLPEIKKFEHEEWFPKYDKNDEALKKNIWVNSLKKEIPENYYEKRKIGENGNYVCELIRKDLIKEFVVYLNQNLISADSKIKPSIHDTNPLLQSNRYLTLIGYAAFFGSINIFNYLRMNGARLNKAMLIYAIHGRNAEIIHFLESLKNDSNSDITEYYETAILCHHNDIVEYIQNNCISNETEISNNTLIYGIKYYNFALIQNNLIDKFYYLCKYDYYEIVKSLLNEKDININEVVVNQSEFMKFKIKYN